MSALLAKHTFDLILGLIRSAIDRSILGKIDSFFVQRRVTSAVEKAVADVVEPLIPFLSQEKITESQQRLVVEICVEQLKPFTEDPKKLFRAGLDGEQVFRKLYPDEHSLPEAIRDEGLKDVYTLLVPRVTTLLCDLPVVLKDWELEGWKENYRRLDELARTLADVSEKVDKFTNDADEQADSVLRQVRRFIAQRVSLHLDLTGLRADQPFQARLQDIFVHPHLMLPPKDNQQSHTAGSKTAHKTLEDESQAIDHFTGRGKRSVLIGGPGSGKTTWSKWLLRVAASDSWSGIAIRIELRKVTREELPSVHTLIRQAAGEHFAEDLDAERIRRWLSVGRVLFILDGLDEVIPDDRDRVVQWLDGLSTRASDCPIVLSSRPLSTCHIDDLPERWQCWHIQPFDETRIVAYIEQWYQHAPLLEDSERDINAKTLASTWRGDPTLSPLTGNPLLLTTLLVVHHLDGALPQGRSQLYARYVDSMLGIWDDRKKDIRAQITLSRPQRHRLLRGIAMRVHFANKDSIPEDDFHGMVAEELKSARINANPTAVIEWLRERSGLIVGPGDYSFSHKSIGEFLVAQTIHEGDMVAPDGQRADRMYLFGNRHNDRWNTALFLWAGLAPTIDTENFVNRCICDSVDPRDFLLAFGVIKDQHDRIGGACKRKSFLRLIKSGVAFPETGPSGAYEPLFIPQRWHRYHERNFPFPQLRSVDGSSNLVKNSLYRFLMSIMQLEHPIETDWRSASPSTTKILLASLHSTNVLPLHRKIGLTWALTVLGTAAESTLRKGAPNDRMAFALKGTAPELDGWIPFFLMTYGMTREHTKSDDPFGFKLYPWKVRVLARSGPSWMIPDELLQDTATVVAGEHTFDLLRYFRSEVVTATKLKIINHDDDVGTLIGWIDQLIERRDAIRQHSSPEDEIPLEER